MPPVSPRVARKRDLLHSVPPRGRVCITVRDPAFREELLSSDFVFEFLLNCPMSLSNLPCPPLSTPFVMRVSKIFLTCVMITVSC